MRPPGKPKWADADARGAGCGGLCAGGLAEAGAACATNAHVRPPLSEVTSRCAANRTPELFSRSSKRSKIRLAWGRAKGVSPVPTVSDLGAYPPIRDHVWWLADFKPRSQMTSEELAAQRVRDRATYQRMRERMVLDPEYREARLAVSRRGTKRWQAMNRDNPTVIEKRRAKDRARWAAFNDELNARKRRAYVGEQAERIRAKNRDWYSRNVERRRAYNKAYRLATRNLLSERERNRRRYAQDPRRWN